MLSIRKIALASIFAMTPALAFGQTELIFNSYLQPYDEMYQVAIKGFAAKIEEESAGSIKIVIPDSTLAPSDRQYEMVRDGIADMALVSSGAVPQLVVLNRIADLPLNAPTAKAASVALWETYEKYFTEFDELKGVKLLSASALPGRPIISVSGVKVTKASDLQNVKLWSPPGALFETAKALGAVAINTEFTALQEYVTKRNVDAIIMTPGSADGARVLENVTSVTQIPGGLGSLSFQVFISNERWNELTEDQQAAILRAADGLPGRTGQAADDAEAETAEKTTDLEVIVPQGGDLASFEAVLGGTIENWKKRASDKGLANPDEVLRFYRSVLERELAQ
jgi:TRAP-type C4-dicarboxylate transport system substrate-binding protein